MDDLTRDFLARAAWLLVFAAVSVGVIFGMDAVGVLPPDPYSGFVGLGLGVLCIFGSFWATY